MMPELYDFERHPLQDVVDSCNEAIAGYRKSLFVGYWLTVFNSGMVLIRGLEFWAEFPWQLFPTGATLIILVTHVFALVVTAGTLRWSYSRRQRWVNLRKSCLAAIQSQSYIAAEFHLDQIHAAFDNLNK